MMAVVGVALLVIGGIRLAGCGTPPSQAGEPGQIHFPQLKPVSGEREFMEAELIGELAVVDECIYVNPREGDTGYLVIWPPEFTVVTENDSIQVRNGAGEVVAQAGEEVYMSGGEIPISEAEWLSQQLRTKLPDTCHGPYWIVGEEVRFHERAE